MGRQPIQVEAFLFRFVNGACQYLLLKRIASRGGFWQPITGGLEEGEELRDAVIREVEEETGIKKIKRIIEDVHQFTLEEEQHRKEYVFGVEINPNEEVVLDNNVYVEHDNHKWCFLDEAIQLLKWPGNKTGLQKLHKMLESNGF